MAIGRYHRENETVFNYQAKKGEDSINLGIAIVIPAKKILEVLNQPELVERRMQAEKEMAKADGATEADADFSEN